jgi:nicotinamide-nucleotide amidase
MRRDQAIADKIRHIFEARGRVMSQNNLRQADIPIGAAPIAQMPGTAPGLVCPIGAKVIYAVPGVPSEMRDMMLGTILPDLRRRAGQSAVIRSRVLRTWGMSESGLAEVLAERMRELDRLGNPTIAYQASGIDGIKVRVVAKCTDEASAAKVLDAEEALIRGLIGHVIFGVDEESMELAVLTALRRQGLTLAAAEQVTGGLLAARLSAADPPLHTFRGARVAPHGGSDDAADLQQRAAAAASQARAEFGTSVGAAAIAGPASQASGPRTAPVALAAVIADRRQSEHIILPADRGRLRDFAVISLLDMLRKALAA